MANCKIGEYERHKNETLAEKLMAMERQMA
jgi:hypothetical protein